MLVISTSHAKFQVPCDLTNMPNIIVQIQPPTKPSTVFFGDTVIRGVLPQKNPQM